MNTLRDRFVPGKNKTGSRRESLSNAETTGAFREDCLRASTNSTFCAISVRARVPQRPVVSSNARYPALLRGDDPRVAFFWLLFLAKQEKVGAQLRRVFAAGQPPASLPKKIPPQIHNTPIPTLYVPESSCCSWRRGIRSAQLGTALVEASTRGSEDRRLFFFGNCVV